MTSKVAERAFWIAAVLLLCFAATSRPRTNHTLLRLTPPTVAPSAQLGGLEPERLAKALDVILSQNLFRLDRRAEGSAMKATPTPVPPQAAGVPKPRFVLRGILGGPPWDAVLEGIPGREGSVVVRTRDSVAGFLIRSVHRDTVVVHGMDTTWRLTMGRP
jgi:hypothetical protein